MPENKYKYWMITVMTDGKKDHYLPSEEDMYSAFNKIGESYVFQKEIQENSELKLEHWQCCLTTKIRVRKSTLLKLMASSLSHDVVRIKVDKIEGTWDQAAEYCSKEDSRVEGSTPSYSPSMQNVYTRSDIDFLWEEDKRYPWQVKLLEKIFDKVPTTIKDPIDREIIWITDKQGNSGKSKFTKFLCVYNPNIVKISFGTANQLRSAVISSGPKMCYILDMPRTLGEDDSILSVISVVEDISNGFLVSSFYGSSTNLIMNPPHVIIFSNKDCPVQTLSLDRWDIYIMENYDFKKYDPYMI